MAEIDLCRIYMFFFFFGENVKAVIHFRASDWRYCIVKGIIWFARDCCNGGDIKSRCVFFWGHLQEGAL